MKIVEASAAVIVQPDGRFLLGQRPEGKPYAGYWEFPGGKIEPGETARAALVRELHEELGIEADIVYPWIMREFVYPHAHVRLHFFRVTRWHGEIRDIQHSALAWQRSGHVDVEPLLPANLPILKALALPDFYAITHGGEIGVGAQLQALERALSAGLRLLQIREPNLSADKNLAFARDAITLARRHGACVLLNGDAELAQRLGADGVHLRSAQLMQLQARPDLALVAASCHNALEVARAGELDLDFAVLGTVRETASHAGLAGMGWEACAALISNSTLPIYALGGLQSRDMETAWQCGAHGIAAMRAAWG